MSADRPHLQVGPDYTVSNKLRQCLGPYCDTVKQAFLHSLLQCPNVDRFLNCWELVHWHFRLRLVLQTNAWLRSADGPRPQMCLFGGSAEADGPSASARKSADPGPQISASAVRTPLKSTHLWAGVPKSLNRESFMLSAINLPLSEKRWCIVNLEVISARQHAEPAICYRPSVRLSHGWISQKWLKLGSCNLHRTVAPSL